MYSVYACAVCTYVHRTCILTCGCAENWCTVCFVHTCRTLTHECSIVYDVLTYGMVLLCNVFCYVCMYVCKYVRTYVSMYVCMSVCMFVCTYVCTVYLLIFRHSYFSAVETNVAVFF